MTKTDGSATSERADSLRPLSPRGVKQLAEFDGNAVRPRDAATVVLLRDSPRGVETLFLRRQSTMAFAAGMHVFPGGGVQGSDTEPGIPWVGPSAQEWADILGCPAELAGALVVAAVRETFEETGVLFAGPDGGTVVADTSTADLREARADLEAKRLSLREFLLARGLVLRADLLYAWAHWITPAQEPRRFDTRFFVAALPDGQRVGAVPREADRTLWLPVRAAADAARAGELEMMAPTSHTCRSLDGLAEVAELAAAAVRPLVTIEPKVVEIAGRYYLDYPPPNEF
ncbi:NUDIX hydrolase [Nocardia flavorosea]|uniref:NUDIX hydrolase n=1 Tax=Nocardia flavorosea TaxID=53429 RepID=A0A846YSG4_9NOCA|nr:NUDIX hydrolase [Nocardia flavorosea]NKY60490.1 NUDIX hydrolase [Nocardia flavorosea]